MSLRIVAFVLISPLFGAYAHLLPRRQVLVALDLVRAATVLLLPFVDAVWQVYVLIFVINACSAGFTPLFQATIPDVLPDEEVYTRALSLSRLAYDLQQLLAPALAGVLLWFLPLHALFAVNGAAFLISAALVLSVMLPGARKVTRPEGVLANVGWDIRLYLVTARLCGLLALSMAVAAATAMVIVNTVVYVRDILGGGDRLVTVAYAVSGGRCGVRAPLSAPSAAVISASSSSFSTAWTSGRRTSRSSASSAFTSSSGGLSLPRGMVCILQVTSHPHTMTPLFQRFCRTFRTRPPSDRFIPNPRIRNYLSGRTGMRTIHCSYDVAHPQVWRLQQPYIRKTSIGTVTVPPRFVWDGASVPRVLWNIIPPWGSYSGAALVHDWLYRTRTSCASSTKTVTKEEADRVFYELMLEDGVRKSRAWAMWQAVALWGGKAWSQTKKDDDDKLVEAALATA